MTPPLPACAADSAESTVLLNMCEAILSKQSPFTDLDNQVKENASHDTVQLILVLQFIYI